MRTRGAIFSMNWSCLRGFFETWEKTITVVHLAWNNSVGRFCLDKDTWFSKKDSGVECWVSFAAKTIILVFSYSLKENKQHPITDYLDACMEVVGKFCLLATTFQLSFIEREVCSLYTDASRLLIYTILLSKLPMYLLQCHKDKSQHSYCT